MITVKEAIKNIQVKFSNAIAGVLYYNLFVGDKTYLFQVDMNDKHDVGTTTFNNEYTGMGMMSYISRALDKNELFEIG